ncbi:MAG: hypothetical protein JNL81_04040 [Hyphomonadaceae bacterium]|nr:hypothetical protein [Hyphomonadaceae bacterium]
MTNAPPPQRSGATGLLLVFSITALLVGLGFDLGAGSRVRFWIGDQPAAAAAVGVAGVLFAVLASHAARLVLAARSKPHQQESSDASSHT